MGLIRHCSWTGVYGVGNFGCLCNVSWNILTTGTEPEGWVEDCTISGSRSYFGERPGTISGRNHNFNIHFSVTACSS